MRNGNFPKLIPMQSGNLWELRIQLNVGRRVFMGNLGLLSLIFNTPFVIQHHKMQGVWDMVSA
jgi:hypothetical protein